MLQIQPNRTMIGAIIGDIVGSTYEFHNTLNYDFELFPHGSSFTDDTICTIAIADAILKGESYRDSIICWCRKYPTPKGAYGNSFVRWIASDNPQPYNSYGNGAAMRISPIGYAFTDSNTVRIEARKATECSHSHPEGIKGAQAIALAIWELRKKQSKEATQQILIDFYNNDYIEHLPKKGEWNETCQGCVPLAIHLFLQSKSFEDAIRLAISYGGDSDTLGAIVGSLAGTFYEIPDEIIFKALSYLPDEMVEIIRKFNELFKMNNKLN